MMLWALISIVLLLALMAGTCACFTPRFPEGFQDQSDPTCIPNRRK